MRRSVKTTPAPLKLTLRRAALLHAIRFGSPPWLDPGERDIAGASEAENGKVWILCCGHVFSAREIEAMAQAGWIVLATQTDRHGKPYRTTIAGPRIKDAWGDV